MTTIKDIAQATGYSASTVSIVLRGQGDKRKIPETTQQLIFETASRLNYTPNTSARRLRSDEPLHRTIAIFWATDFRVSMVASFLKGVQNYIEENSSDIEVTIRPYQVGKISEVATRQNLAMYAGAIICTASRADMDYIEAASLATPLVIYNRRSDKYPTVSTDHEEIGRFAAERLQQHGCSSISIITDAAERSYSHRRQVSFIETVKNGGIEPTVIKIGECSVDSGYQSTRAYLASLDFTREIGIFTSADNLAFGAIRAINELPKDKQGRIHLISIGTREPAMYRCFNPIPEIIEIPMTRMAELCTERLDTLMRGESPAEFETYVPFTHLQP